MARIKKPKSWLENKIAKIRRLARPQSSRFYRATKKFGSLGIVALFVLPLIGSFLLPKDHFQQAKEKLVDNPMNFEAHLVLTEEFLKNNQFEEAKKELVLAQAIHDKQYAIRNPEKTVLGEQATTKLNNLWEQKRYSDPKDIQRLIIAWEQIINDKPNYRDGYLQLAYLYYKLSEDGKAKQALQKALELDPNFEPAQELERILND